MDRVGPPGSFGGTDIHISFKGKMELDRILSIPVEKVNTELEERFPSKFTAGDILFFLKDYDNEHQDFYWIDAGFIEELKKQN